MDLTEGTYVTIDEDNDPSGRYNGKKGLISDVLHQNDQTLYLVEVDINSGDQGTCIAKSVTPVVMDHLVVINNPLKIEQG